MRSRILHGSVWHMRTRPRYFFRYGVFYLHLALDELDEVGRRIRPFSHNRLNLLSVRDADYLALAERQETGLSPNLSLITQPRLLGYAFNPVSFVLRHDANGALERVLAEVHNTWGERHLYDLARTQGSSTYHAPADKAFYVSPFMDIDGRYSFRLREDPGRMRIRIDETRPAEAQPFFRSGMDLTPLPLTNANVLAMLLRYPLQNLKTIAAIHWQGIRLWRRGEPFRPNPSRARKAKVPA